MGKQRVKGMGLNTAVTGYGAYQAHKTAQASRQTAEALARQNDMIATQQSNDHRFRYETDPAYRQWVDAEHLREAERQQLEAAQRAADLAAAEARKQANAKGQWALYLGIASLVIWGLGPILGGLGLYLGLQHRPAVSLGPADNGAATMIGIVLSGLGILVGLTYWIGAAIS